MFFWVMWLPNRVVCLGAHLNAFCVTQDVTQSCQSWSWARSAGGVVAVDSGLSAIQHKGLPSAAAPAIFSMVNPLKIVMQGLL